MTVSIGNTFGRGHIWLVILAGLLVTNAAIAQPAAWPGDTDWIHLQDDPDEGGIHNDNRDVEETLYFVEDGFLFLRMKMHGPAGWCAECGQSLEHARYKWFFDTVGADAAVQGGNVQDAEFMLFVEDYEDDLVGEVVFIDDPANTGFTERWDSTNPPRYVVNNPVPPPFPDWKRVSGAVDAVSYPVPDPETDPFLGVPRSATGTEVGFRLFGGADVQSDGIYMDMYLDLALIGSPDGLRLLWLTDQENTNLDQAPCCDRPDQGDFIVIPTTGSIEIRKDASPDGPTSFPFTGDLGAFALVDDGMPANAVELFEDLEPGTWDVTESVPAGWTLGSILCSGDDDGGTTVNIGTATASIELDAGETISCLFVDVEQPAEGGTITIVKHSLPHSATSFGFTGDLGAFSLTDNGTDPNLITFTGVSAGTYDVTEAVPGGWNLTGLACVDPSGGTSVSLGTATATIGLAEGDVVTCTFTNTQNGQITIVKNADPADDTAFDFTGDGGLGAFTLTDPSDTTETFPDLVPGTYQVTETVPGGWNLTNLVCDDDDGGTDLASATATIQLDPGEAVTCTFTNTVPGTLTVVKDSVPDDPQVFQFLAGIGNFSLYDDGTGTGDSITYDGLSPAPVDLPAQTGQSVQEQPVDGWQLTALTCDDPDAGSIIDIGSGTAYADIDAGETVTCTFVNTAVARATFLVTKDFADGNPEGVEVAISCNTGLPLEQSQVITEQEFVEFVVVEYDPGELDCVVYEVAPVGYTPTYLAGFETFANGEFAQGEDGCRFVDVLNGDFTCDMTNTPDPVDIVIGKDWVVEGGSLEGIDTYYELTLYCDSEIVGGTTQCRDGAETPQGEPQPVDDWCRTFQGSTSDTFSAGVIPDYPSTNCRVVETVFDDAVEIRNDCDNLIVSAGEGDSCAITNTVFFEGIPTLGRHGLAILAMLMLGVGLIAYRRFG